MKEYLDITYKISKSENYEEYLKAMGLKPLEDSNSSLVKLTFKDGVYMFTTTSPNYSFSFKDNEEFEDNSCEGKKLKSIVNFDGNKMIQHQKLENGEVLSSIIREFNDKRMKAVFKVGEVVSTLVYDKIE